MSGVLVPVQNSNLVLTAETRTRDAAEPSGEPETLWGKMRGKMGDRVQHTKPEGYDKRKTQAKKKCVPAFVPAFVPTCVVCSTALSLCSFACICRTTCMSLSAQDER